GELTGDARINYEILACSGADLHDMSSVADDRPDLTRLLDSHARGSEWLIDAMLGKGSQGAPREPIGAAIDWMNAQSARRLAADIPSGLDCDTGETPGGEAVRADVTCTFVAPKPGLLTPTAAPWVGDLRVVSIGIPQVVVDRVLAAK